MKKFFFSSTTKWAVVLIISISVIGIAFIFRYQLIHFRSLGLFGIFLANFLGSATLFLPAPAIATVIAGGLLYPPLLVALFATVGAVLGDMLGFFLGSSGKHMFFKRKDKTYARLTKLFKKYGGLMVFLFAFVPNPIFDAVGIIAGVLEYPLWKFAFFLFLGRFARNILLSFFGARL